MGSDKQVVIIHTTKLYKYLSAFFAFLLWGGWAFYINHNAINHSGLISGIVQGCCSFVITLIITHFIVIQFNWFTNNIAKIILPPVITISFTSFFLVLIHSLAGTPSILYTVLPAISIAFLFAFFTVYKLHKTSQLQDKSDDNQ